MIKNIIGFISKLQVKKLKPFSDKLTSNDLKISICDANIEIAQVFAEVFEGMPEVEVLHGNIFNLWTDAIVSPANSFGEMSGGIDKAIDDFYKKKAQPKVVNYIQEEFLGELPVGLAVTLKMDSIQFPHLLVAPTMRIPGMLKDSVNAYLAFRAVLVQNKKGINNLKHIAVPAFCTGVGGMGYRESAEQMLMAYKNVMLSGWMEVKHPAMAPYAYKSK